MARNVYFSQGTRNEQYLIEDIIIESLQIYGQELYYIPRTLVSKDEILGEDRLSEFKTAFNIEMYFENVDSFDGQGAFIQKFGLMMEQSATLVVARRRWEQLVGRYGDTIIPTRPCEGDLLYFPLTKGLFEIKFVKHQDPFYQLGKLYTYKLQVELFQYNSEVICTGLDEVDVFESLKTMNTNPNSNSNGQVTSITVLDGGSGYTQATIQIQANKGYGARAEAVIEDGVIVSVTMLETGNGYPSPDAMIVRAIGDSITQASLIAVVESNIDKVESYGDNNKFKEEGSQFMFNENNPFGDVNSSTPEIIREYTADSSIIRADTTTITADLV